MYRCQCRFRRSDGLNSESGGEIDGDGQPQIFLSSSVRSSKKNSMRTFQIWSEGDCFCYSMYGSNEHCSLSPHNGRPQIFLSFSWRLRTLPLSLFLSLCPRPRRLSLPLFLSLCAQYFNRLIFLFIERLLNDVIAFPNN